MEGDCEVLAEVAAESGDVQFVEGCDDLEELLFANEVLGKLSAG